MALTPSDGFPYYIGLLQDKDYLAVLKSESNINALTALSEDKASFRYAPGKWSIKQVVGHMTDHERIMMYRALRFSRNDDTQLPGYDQDVLVDGANFDNVLFKDLMDDFRNVRMSTLSFIKTLSPQQFLNKGKAWKFEITVSDVLKATAGHELHHINILRERYSI
jgi:DinB superfamily